jgi:hypothetical protein
VPGMNSGLTASNPALEAAFRPALRSLGTFAFLTFGGGAMSRGGVSSWPCFAAELAQAVGQSIRSPEASG